jgi:hypothetical protein
LLRRRVGCLELWSFLSRPGYEAVWSRLAHGPGPFLFFGPLYMSPKEKRFVVFVCLLSRALLLSPNVHANIFTAYCHSRGDGAWPRPPARRAAASMPLPSMSCSSAGFSFLVCSTRKTHPRLETGAWSWGCVPCEYDLLRSGRGGDGGR